MAFVDALSDELRQGDICFAWPFPQWNMNTFQVAIEVASDSRQRAITNLHDRGAKLPIVICSHDCEVENSRTRAGLVVAPLLRWPFPSLESNSSLDLMHARVPSEKREYDYINWFPVNLRSADLDDWRVVDFSAMSSMSPPHKIKSQLLATKKYELTEISRVEFKEKLAMFFGR